MKKVLAMVLAAVLAFSMFACGTTDEGKTSAGATSADAAKKYKVAMICDSNISDGGWGAACYNAMIAAASQNNWDTAITDQIAQNDYYNSIASYCDLGYDLIFAPGSQYTDAVLQAAEIYPDVAFALLNGAANVPEKATNKNVTSLLPNAQQIGWIAGALAGLMTESGVIAFIGGMELDTTKQKYEGFGEAAKFVAEKEGKTVTLLDCVYAGSFNDSAKGIEFAKAMIEKNADVFFGDASAVDSGARQAIDEANTANGSVKIYDIGQPADILGQNACVICSQVTDNAAMIGNCMKAVAGGTFGGEVLYGTMQNGALSAGKLSDLVPADKQEKYKAYIQEMIDGTFMK